MPSKKIAIIGSHFVGKTSLCRKLSKYLKERGHNVGFIGEMVRECPFPVNEMATVQAQDWIFEEQKRREAELGKRHDILLLDRGVIDNYGYWLRVAQNLRLDGGIIEKREKEVFEHSTGYDLLLFLHPFDSEDIQNDNFRSVDPVWRKEMHDRVSDIMRRFQSQSNIPVISIKGTEEEVFQQAKGYVERLVEK